MLKILEMLGKRRVISPRALPTFGVGMFLSAAKQDASTAATTPEAEMCCAPPSHAATLTRRHENLDRERTRKSSQRNAKPYHVGL
jgi:hypothetical protein